MSFFGKRWNMRLAGKHRWMMKAGGISVALALLLALAGCDFQLDLAVGRREPLTGLYIAVTGADVSVGAQFALTSDPCGENADWISSDESVAAVEDGIVTAVAEGRSLVTYSDGEKFFTCDVTVRSEILGVRVMTADANLAAGDTLNFSAELPKGYKAKWSTSDESVLTVNDGTMSAVGGGNASIGATCREFAAAYEILSICTVAGDGERQLLWADEFDGDALDETKWEYQEGVQDAYINMEDTAYGPWFWGNNELQYYTRDAVSLVEGVLSITAERKEGLASGREFTSARISTRDRGYWTYGYFEARMKLPLGTGMWPAFWMLPQPEPGMGTNNRYGGWAANGEIDIMEAKGRLPYEIGNTLHFGGNPSIYSPHAEKLTAPIDEWHVYGFEWRNDHMSWFVDGEETYRLKNTSWFTSSPLGEGNAAAPFDVPFYLLINLAVGGNYDGGNTPDKSFTSAAMQIDYVRVYA